MANHVTTITTSGTVTIPSSYGGNFAYDVRGGSGGSGSGVSGGGGGGSRVTSTWPVQIGDVLTAVIGTAGASSVYGSAATWAGGTGAHAGGTGGAGPTSLGFGGGGGGGSSSLTDTTQGVLLAEAAGGGGQGGGSLANGVTAAGGYGGGGGASPAAGANGPSNGTYTAAYDGAGGMPATSTSGGSGGSAATTVLTGTATAGTAGTSTGGSGGVSGGSNEGGGGGGGGGGVFGGGGGGAGSPSQVSQAYDGAGGGGGGGYSTATQDPTSTSAPNFFDGGASGAGQIILTWLGLPTAMVTAPATGSTVTTTSEPNVTWTYMSADSSAQASYRVVAYLQPSGGFPSGFNPITGYYPADNGVPLVPVADTGTQYGSGVNTTQIPSLLPNGVYGIFVIVTDSGTSGQNIGTNYSAASIVTIAVPGPAAPTLTPAPVQAAARVDVALTAAAPTSTLPPTSYFHVQRSLDGVTWQECHSGATVQNPGMGNPGFEQGTFPNLLSPADAGFETGSIGSWIATGATLALTTAQAQAGTHSLQITLSAASATVTSGKYPCTAGVPYVGSFYVRTASTSLTVSCNIVFYNALGTVVGSGYTVSATEPSSSWYQIGPSTQNTAPAGATQMVVQWSVTGGASGQVHYLDTVNLAVGPAYPWVGYISAGTPPNVALSTSAHSGNYAASVSLYTPAIVQGLSTPVSYTPFMPVTMSVWAKATNAGPVTLTAYDGTTPYTVTKTLAANTWTQFSLAFTPQTSSGSYVITTSAAQPSNSYLYVDDLATTVTFRDRGAPRECNVWYQAIPVYMPTYGGQIVGTTSVQAETYLLSDGHEWMICAANPAYDQQVDIQGPNGTAGTSHEDQAVYQPEGRPDAVVFAGTIHDEQFIAGVGSSILIFMFRTDQAWANFIAARNTQQPVCYKSVYGDATTGLEQFWIRLAADVATTRYTGAIRSGIGPGNRYDNGNQVGQIREVQVGASVVAEPA